MLRTVPSQIYLSRVIARAVQRTCHMQNIASEPTECPVALPVIHVGSDDCLWCSLAMHHAAINTLLKDVQYAISKC